ncbi:hypothetical protein PHYBOEH_001021 [Phytophthora boehmeriae]|uniref:Uncharacterized protein n=1 Tax=Phytophthora boehmeriae TaxID=109152 RepID=A0A8T1X6R9_9STRA|nr:hypothetical protein PHYBOEH_001021 [Phytophthora boehmeriae]
MNDLARAINADDESVVDTEVESLDEEVIKFAEFAELSNDVVVELIELSVALLLASLPLKLLVFVTMISNPFEPVDEMSVVVVVAVAPEDAVVVVVLELVPDDEVVVIAFPLAIDPVAVEDTAPLVVVEVLELPSVVEVLVLLPVFVMVVEVEALSIAASAADDVVVDVVDAVLAEPDVS